MDMTKNDYLAESAYMQRQSAQFSKFARANIETGLEGVARDHQRKSAEYTRLSIEYRQKALSMPETMKFAEFQQTRTLVHIAEETDFEDLHGNAGVISGFKYETGCYIACLDDGSFNLIIENWCDRTTRDLTALERILWGFWYLPKDATLSVNDTTLDDYILSWCDYRGIECDGDLYGVLFSTRDTFQLSEAENILRSHHKSAFGHSAVFGEKLGTD